MPSDPGLRQVASLATVPVWVPFPLPAGWLLTGLRWAGSDATGAVATVVACSGPHPLPGAAADGEPQVRSAELLFVAEEPGVGLGAHLAGLASVDPGDQLGEGPPAIRLHAAGHDVPLWWTQADGCAAFVGEAAGVWLWVLAWPSDASPVLMERFELHDAREPAHELVLGFGALSPRI
jgi:hypothetical protein